LKQGAREVSERTALHSKHLAGQSVVTSSASGGEMRSGVTHLEEEPQRDAPTEEDSDQEFQDAEEGAALLPPPRACRK